MRMQKGICIELNENRSVFMMPDGKFVHGSPVKEAVIGEEVYFYPMTLKSARKIQWRPLWAPFIAALAIAILFFSALLPAQETFAYVQVQINPGIELGLNEEYEVVSIRNLNEDGNELIEQLGHWKQEPLDQILNRVLKLCITDSIKEVVITTVDDNLQNETEEEIEKMMLAVPSTVLRKDISIKLKEATREQRERSLEESIPVGQLVEKSTEIEKEAEEAEKHPIKVPSKVKPEKTQPQKEKAEKKPKESNKNEKAPEKNKMKKESPGQDKKELPKQQKEENKKETEKKVKETEKKKKEPEKKKNSQGNGKEKNNEKKKEKSNEKNYEKEQGKSKGNSKVKDKAPGQQKKNEMNKKQTEKNSQKGNGKKSQTPSQNKAKNSSTGQEKKNNTSGGNKKESPKRE